VFSNARRIAPPIREGVMIARMRLSYISCALAVVASAFCLAGSAIAQDKPIRVRGEIVALDGSMMTVKSRDGKELKIKLADNVGVAGIVPMKIGDIKPNSYIGVSAMPERCMFTFFRKRCAALPRASVPGTCGRKAR
jgi:hypothetical protein